jgi:putative membrane protein
MKNFLVKTIANAAALAVAIWLLKDITLTENNIGQEAITLILVALIFGVVNFIVKPIVKLLAFPLFILTLGLITLVINAVMLLLTSGVANRLDLSFHVDNFGAALIGGLIVSVVSWILHIVLPD